MPERKTGVAWACGGAYSEALQLVGLDLSKHVWSTLAMLWFIYMLLSSDPGNECIMNTVWKILQIAQRGKKKNPPEKPHH